MVGSAGLAYISETCFLLRQYLEMQLIIQVGAAGRYGSGGRPFQIQ